MREAAKFAPGPARRAMIAKAHLAAKELRLTEDDRRAVAERVTGKRSAGDMTEAQLDKLLAEFRRLGWKPAPRRADGRTARPASHPAAAKARAMWLSLHALGEVRDPSERALEAFAERQLGGPLQWADQARCYRLIEALKAWAERAGWSQDVAGVLPGHEARVLVERLCRAIEQRIADAGGTPAVKRWPGASVKEMQDSAAILGEQLRRLRGGA